MTGFFQLGPISMIGTLTGSSAAEEGVNKNITFELTRENKSRSSCPKDQHKHLTYDM